MFAFGIDHTVVISLEGEWGARASRTQVVAIGAAGTFDGEVLQATFEQCAGARP